MAFAAHGAPAVIALITVPMAMAITGPHLMPIGAARLGLGVARGGIAVILPIMGGCPAAGISRNVIAYCTEFNDI
jgi:hypothetical protein